MKLFDRLPISQRIAKAAFCRDDKLSKHSYDHILKKNYRHVPNT